MKELKSINVQLGTHIREERERFNYTQERLAEIINLTPNHLSAIERGVSGVSIETLIRLSSALGISTDQLIWGNSKDNNEKTLLLQILETIPVTLYPEVSEILKSISKIANQK